MVKTAIAASVVVGAIAVAARNAFNLDWAAAIVAGVVVAGLCVGGAVALVGHALNEMDNQISNGDQ